MPTNTKIAFWGVESAKTGYVRHWAEFEDWCKAHGATIAELPVVPVLVAAHLGSLAKTHGGSALRGRMAAIACHHRRRGAPFTSTQPVLRETLCGIRRSHKRPVRPAAALTSPHIRLLLATGTTDLAGLRDRALFLIDFGGAFLGGAR